MTQADLVQHLIRRRILQTPRIISALQATDRAHYSPRDPYTDSPQGIGSNATISAPHMHAHCLELVHHKLAPGAHVLDVGCGSGYLTACLARLVGPTGRVVGIEHIQALTDLSRRNLNRDDPALLQTGAVILVTGDGRLGYPPEAPYDVIHVGAASPTFPQALADQLKPDGILVVPEGLQGGAQELVMYTKEPSGRLRRKVLFGVRYVPLTDAHAQLEGQER